MNKVFFALGVSVLSPLALAKPVIATSVKPVSMIVAAIAGDKAEIQQIVSSTASPHDFAMRPSDLKKIINADTVVWVGESLEGFLEKPLENAGKEKSSIEWLALEGMKLHNFAQEHDDHEPHAGEHHDEHAAHAGEHHDEHAAHAGEHHDDHEGHDHTGIDPHVWLSPDNALVLAKAVTVRLASLDSANAAYYQGNLAAFEKGLSAKDAEIRQALNKVNTVPYIVFHDGYSYFEQHYGLQNAGEITVSPERKPGAKKVAEIRREIEEHKVQCVFSEPQFSPAIVTTLLEGSNVKTASLDPLGGEVKMGSNAYFAFLDNLSGQFLSCLR
ncbi:zinc ABC transporter substrate-binding protein ZnuA [Marinomonas sp. M1K-6]|uniref:High-affinity zinc uptake system protein ZnuA n=1 Tax=Marinomonas profundi TaxID=2726122 RepID=A0A847R360_9GAMM|nr:zinc ABC transporter substrate-binding protein ZnuA [Marinomonas profundi]NLQ18302.1 zinc ABC transporter substrate-binding protein ZnuA [Marinomonas profundi]UDV02365.1 zinc ABC transporter substrate-binding protein ZnuA [Marinomonas profundi]